MTINDSIRAVRFALNMKNSGVRELISKGGGEISSDETIALLKKEDQDGFVEATPEQVHQFLDGLILKMRGPSDKPAPKFDISNISNNMILRKLRIAFEMKDTDVLATLRLTGFNMSKAELGAMSRRKGHAQYMECGDQFLRNFLRGLVIKFKKTK